MQMTTETILPDGTPVQVQSKRGRVVGHAVKRDQFGGNIVVHTIELTEISKSRTAAGRKWEPFGPEVSPCNYSFIQPIIG